MKNRIVALTLLSALPLHAAVAAPDAALVATTANAVAAGAAGQTLTHGKFGRLVIYTPAQQPTNVAIVISGASGWTPAAADLAHTLVGSGAAVIGVDLPRYLAGLKRLHGSCSLLGADFESLSHGVQKQLKLRDYHVPMLISDQGGATLLHAVLATAPFGTFSGAITQAPAALSDFRCPAQANDRTAPGWQRTHITVQPAPGAAVAAQRAAAVALSADFTESSARALPPKIDAPQISDLPLTLVDASGSDSDMLTLLMTGDGGWAGIDRELSRVLASRGIPVIGFNTLKYFWQKRTPAEVSAAVARVLRHYLVAWKRERIVLVGYSFGADVMPFVIEGLPPDLRQRIVSVSLLGLSEYASFEVHVADWLPGVSSNDSPVLPQLAKLHGLRVLCVYGEGEKDTLCPQLANTGITALRVGQGHHFSGQYDAIADAILRPH